MTRVNEMQKVVSGRDVRDDKMYDGRHQGSLIVQSLEEATALDPTARLETLNT